MKKASIEETLTKCKRNLERGIAVITPIIIYEVIVNPFKEILLKRNESGLLEIPNDELQITDFEQEFSNPEETAFAFLRRVLREKTGMSLVANLPKKIYLTGFSHKDGGIALTAVAIIPGAGVIETSNFKTSLLKGEVKFYTTEALIKRTDIDPESLQIAYYLEKDT